MLKFELTRNAVRTRIYTSDSLMYAHGVGGRYGELQGYELIAIVEDEMQITVPDETKEKPMYGQQPTKMVPAKRALFVFEQSESAALAQAESARHHAEGLAHDLTTQNTELAQKLLTEVEPLKRAASKHEEEKQRLERRFEDARQQAQQERSARMKLEDDLATVRTAIEHLVGDALDIRWKEIVES